jgi:siroheme synthase (precorrin-2 oxidase/ferrochelatase)
MNPMWRTVALCALLTGTMGCAAGALAKDGREQERRRNAQRQERNDRYEEIMRRCDERKQSGEDPEKVEEECRREVQENLPPASRKSHQIP